MMPQPVSATDSRVCSSLVVTTDVSVNGSGSYSKPASFMHAAIASCMTSHCARPYSDIPRASSK